MMLPFYDDYILLKLFLDVFAMPVKSGVKDDRDMSILAYYDYEFSRFVLKEARGLAIPT